MYENFAIHQFLFADLCKIDQESKKELAPAEGYHTTPYPMSHLYPGPSEGKVNLFTWS